ncbi:MAG: bifunctional phosphopantothenoylcysteine decarboxylase/phosphopantothenate synthase, partial [Alphaproteobacteria bacterium]|nr:bifunctional phosphopantothenoylcysteine decarboxylase/phosphopantothenate synthase [Alphaproteobacteria bacterium]
ACEKVLPFDVFVGAAAVADWRPANEAEDKLKKGTADVRIDLVENPDILATLSRAGAKRPCLVIGFAAETDHVEEQATEKLKRKGCDWLLANEVGAGKGFGEVENAITLLRREAQGRVVTTPWPRQSKEAIARKLVEEIVRAFRK